MSDDDSLPANPGRSPGIELSISSASTGADILRAGGLGRPAILRGLGQASDWQR